MQTNKSNIVLSFRPPGGNFEDRIHRFFAHLIPAHIVDTICRLTGHKPFLVRQINKMHRGMAPLEWFASRQWIWANDNVVALSEELNATSGSAAGRTTSTGTSTGSTTSTPCGNTCSSTVTTPSRRAG